MENVERYVLAALSLHLRQADNAVYCPLCFVDSEASSGYIKPGEWRSIIQLGDAFQPLPRPHNSTNRTSAIDMREALKEYLIGPGEVSWQTSYVRRTGEVLSKH